MSYIEQLEIEAGYTSTLNGAKTHSTSGDACLDLFATAGGMRWRKPSQQIMAFDKAYIENPEIAMKLLFHIRDIRGGMGERKMFRTLIRHMAKTWPGSVKKNIAFIAEYGRWDDLLCLMNTPVEATVIEVIASRLEKDLEALERRVSGDKDAPISLLAKWLPSSNASSKATCATAKRLYKALHMSERDYRRMLSDLRRHICLTERYLTRKQPEKIRYEAVPAGAMLKYRKAFETRDGERFGDYLEQVLCDEKTMHADTLFPYEILRPHFRNRFTPYFNEKGAKTLEALWKSMSTQPGEANAISVIDTSGSMYMSSGSRVLPALISQAMGIYCAERCEGVFHNRFITFESEPHLVHLHGRTLEEKLRYLESVPWGRSTNLEAVFDLILNAAINANAAQEEMPSVIYIFSDMEFNMAMGGCDKTNYELAKEKFESAGYRMPAVVFHNVNSWQMQVPVRKGTCGTALTSGASVSALKEKFDGNITPMDHMLRVLNGKRYEPIHA